MRLVGGGSGDDFGSRVPEGGFGFFPRAPAHRFPSDFGPSSFEFQRPRFEREFSCFGPKFSTSSVPFYPTYEQMARHWFASFANPSVGPFAHPFDR